MKEWAKASLQVLAECHSTKTSNYTRRLLVSVRTMKHFIRHQVLFITIVTLAEVYNRIMELGVSNYRVMSYESSGRISKILHIEFSQSSIEARVINFHGHFKVLVY